MKKKMIFVLIGIFLVVSVTAVSVGQIFTQQQIDNINVSTFDLGEKFLRDGDSKIKYNCSMKLCVVWITLLSVDREILINETDNSSYWTGDYIVVDRIREIRFRKEPWRIIRDELGANEAKKQLSNWLKYKKIKLVNQERAYLEDIQTEENVDLSNILEGLE